MPVSKNKRKNHASKQRRADKRAERIKKLNSAPVVLSSGLRDFNHMLEQIRRVSNTYVQITKQIPGYQETNPDLQPGLVKAIPILKELNTERDRISDAIKVLHQRQAHEDEYFQLMSDFEALTLRFGSEFMDAYLPMFDSLEALGKNYPNIDVKLIADTRLLALQHKPEFKTDVGKQDVAEVKAEAVSTTEETYSEE